MCVEAHGMAHPPGANGDVDPAQLAGGIFAVGFDGADAASAPLAALRAFAPGAVVLFGRNVGTPAALQPLIAELRALASPPPLIMIDQEGGTVARLRTGVAQLPAAMALGAAGDVTLIEHLGTLLGRDLARLGVSVDLAPVADLAAGTPNALGTRAYSDDPNQVASCAGAFARGLTRGGVAPALKHFPGHGATADDSHVTLPRATAGAAALRGRDLAPFAQLIAEHAVPLIMTAHIVVEAFDGERAATLSRSVLHDVLRVELGFDGVIVTDCLEMDAIAARIGTVRGAVEALAAGADLLLVSHQLELARAAAGAVVAAVHDGSVPFERLREAHARVTQLRQRYVQLDPYAGPLDENLPLEAARRAVTVLRGDVRLRADAAVTVISFEPQDADRAGTSGGGAGADDGSLSAALRRRGWKSEHMRVAGAPDANDVALLVEHVVRLGERDFVIVTRNAERHPGQRAAVERLLRAAPDAVVVSAALPFDAFLWPAARRVACTYGDRAPAFDGCADVLTGRAAARGRLPFRPAENVAVR